MRPRILLIIQNLSKSGSPLTFLHVIYALKDKYDIDVAVARVNDPKIDLEYKQLYEDNIDNLYLFKINSHTLFNRAFPYLAYKPLFKLANNKKYSFIITNIFEVGALLIKNHVLPKVFFYSLDRLSLDSKYKIVNKRKRRMLDYLGNADCFIALTSNCFYDWFDFSKNNYCILLDYPDIEQKKDKKIFHDKELVLGIIGYYCEKKNQLFALSLLKTIDDMGINASLQIMGYYFENDKTYYKKMVNFIRNNNLQNKVHFLNKNIDKKEYFDSIDVLLCPSKYEGLGLVLLESQYRKTPCIASDVLPKESQLGLISFCSLDNPQSWINAIKDNVANLTTMRIKDNLKSEFDSTLLNIINLFL